MGRARSIVALAEAVRLETIAVFDIDPERVVTIPNGVDSRRLAPSASRAEIRARLDVAPRAKILLSVAALTWEKDPAVHVEVGAAVLRRCPDAVHLIAGDGPLRDDIRGRIRSIGLGGRMRVLGSRGDVADLLTASDVMLFASRPDGMEGMPTIMIEAGMSGLPVVGFDVAGVGEVIDDCRTGILVPWGDVEGLSGEVLALLFDDERRLSMGAAAQETCDGRFDVARLAPRYLELYEGLAVRS